MSSTKAKKDTSSLLMVRAKSASQKDWVIFNIHLIFVMTNYFFVFVKFSVISNIVKKLKL